MNKKIFQISKYIRENLQDPPTEEFICDEFRISECSLRKGFKQLFGQNLGGYGRKQRLKSAAELRVAKENSISIVAESVGFGNASRFAEALRNEFGMIPFRFRKLGKPLTGSSYTGCPVKSQGIKVRSFD